MIVADVVSRVARPFLLAGLLSLAGLAAQAQDAPPPAASGAPQPPAASQPPAPADAQSDAPSDTSAAVDVKLEPRPTLALSGTSDWDDGLHTIMDSFDKIREEMAKAGLQPGGRPIAVFTETDDKGFRFDAMIPLTVPAATDAAFGQSVRAALSPAGKTMKFEHRGSYDDIDSTYEAITAYLDEKGLDAQNLFIEEYLNTPQGSDDPDFQVDIYVFLK